MQWVVSAWLCKGGSVSFVFLQSLSGLPAMHIPFWLNAYSVIEVFPFFTTFVERFSVLEEDFVF